MEVHTKLGVLQHPTRSPPIQAKRKHGFATHRCALIANVRVYRTRVMDCHGKQTRVGQ